MELSFSALVLCGFYFVSCFKKQPAISGNAEFKKKNGGGGGKETEKTYQAFL